MRFILLTILTMTAFAANSVLTRMGVAQFATDPILFAVVRVAAGAAMLSILVTWRGTLRPVRSWGRALGGAASLALYMAGFSLAYLSLDAGVGALILFGGVQITMFVGAALGGEKFGPARLIGAAIALVGLGVLVWPSGESVLDPLGIALMIAAAVGWGIYSLLGRLEADPLAGTASNFLICLPMVLPLMFVAGEAWTASGITIAIVAGGVTSGLGYALWYSVVPQLGASRAAVAQLSVPVIAALGGIVVLSEAVDWRFWVSAGLVLGGIAVSLRKA